MNVKRRAHPRAPGSTGRWPVGVGGPPNASGVPGRSANTLHSPHASFPNGTDNYRRRFRRAAGTDRPAACAPQRFA